MDGKPVIAVSIFPVASLVEQLTGDWAEVTTLLQPGASEHEGEFTPDQVRRLNRADLLIVVGMNLDPWAEQAAQHAERKLPIWSMADLLGSRADVDNLHPVSEAGADSRPPRSGGDEQAGKRPPPEPGPPNNHLWLDPVLARRFVAALAGKLAERYPAHGDAIRAAAEKLNDDLKELDAEYREQLALVPQHELITFHNAFDLIARRYGLTVVAHLTDIDLLPGGEVPPDRFMEAVRAIRQYKLNAVYAEPEFPDVVLNSIHRETGVELLQLDPLGGPRQPGYQTYQEMMRSNLKALVKGQRRDGAETGTSGPGPDARERKPDSHELPPSKPRLPLEPPAAAPQSNSDHSGQARDGIVAPK